MKFAFISTFHIHIIIGACGRPAPVQHLNSNGLLSAYLIEPFLFPTQVEINRRISFMMSIYLTVLRSILDQARLDWTGLSIFSKSDGTWALLSLLNLKHSRDAVGCTRIAPFLKGAAPKMSLCHIFQWNLLGVSHFFFGSKWQTDSLDDFSSAVSWSVQWILNSASLC